MASFGKVPSLNGPEPDDLAVLNDNIYLGRQCWKHQPSNCNMHSYNFYMYALESSRLRFARPSKTAVVRQLDLDGYESHDM